MGIFDFLKGKNKTDDSSVGTFSPTPPASTSGSGSGSTYFTPAQVTASNSSNRSVPQVDQEFVPEYFRTEGDNNNG